MASDKSESKKLALLYLQDLFLERTDETHFIRMPDILEYLAERNVFVDRRTVYTDISILNQAGFEIVGVAEKGGYKYHHPSRLFDTSELKFLIDSIAASKFLTERKSKELITKAKTLGSSFDNAALNRGVLSPKRIKSMNDKVFKNLDLLYAAISSNSQITFQYMRWNTMRKLEPLRSGKLFSASPCAVSLSDDNYYLVAFDSRTNTLRHYRIDKMSSIKLTYEPREGKDIFKSFDIVDYSRKTFGMFSGQEETVTVEAPNNLVGVFIDRFGEAANIRKNFNNPDTFLVRIAVNVSPQFFAWIFGLGKDVKIISPQSVRDEFVKTTNDILSNYNP
ncbi:MAG: transcriptional regulator [Dorea sp.]|nr:transcriptional regulator [Dorea sp.]